MTPATDAREFKVLPLDAIDAPANPSRETMDERKLEELKGSIRQLGILQPLNVARAGDRFEVIAGHRRYLAASQLGLVGVPCLIYPDSDAALEAVKYAENRHREDLNPADEAIWFAELLERHCEGDTDKLAEFLGEKRDYVEGRLLFLRGNEHVFQALQAGTIKIGVARQLNRVTDAGHCCHLLDHAVRGGATQAVVQGWVADWERSRGLTTDAPPPTASEAMAGVAAADSVFRCYVCHGGDHVHTMQSIFVHQHCQLAILDKMLAAYRGEQDPTGVH